MVDTYISFYLRTNRFHIYVDALRGIGSPRYVCFLVEQTGTSMIMQPYHKKDFHSFRVNSDVYDGDGRLEISSMALCRMLSRINSWDENISYRIPGRVFPNQKKIVFNLAAAVPIERMSS